MALLWEKQQGSTRYEVRTAGASRRLYTNGVFHSQYNPRQPVTGSVWDLLTIPAFLAPTTIRRALLLGVGGGAVIHQLNHFFNLQSIVGVELDRVHLTVARRFFDVAAPNVKLHRDDAVRWVEGYRGEPFTMIIDDLFGEIAGEPRRAVTADRHWFMQLERLLVSEGVLVANFASMQELKSCAWAQSGRLRKRFPAAFSLTAPTFDNAVGVFLRQPTDSNRLRRHLRRVPELARALRGGRLNYRIRQLRPQ